MDDTLFLLKPSALQGIGVFAAQAISCSTLVFPDWSRMVKRNINDIPPDFIHFCIFVNDEQALCPPRYDYLTMDNYLNHSFEPNVKINSHKKMETVRNINKGEEILINYNQFNEPEHLKSTYYCLHKMDGHKRVIYPTQTQ